MYTNVAIICILVGLFLIRMEVTSYIGAFVTFFRDMIGTCRIRAVL